MTDLAASALVMMTKVAVAAMPPCHPMLPTPRKRPLRRRCAKAVVAVADGFLATRSDDRVHGRRIPAEATAPAKVATRTPMAPAVTAAAIGGTGMDPVIATPGAATGTATGIMTAMTDTIGIDAMETTAIGTAATAMIATAIGSAVAIRRCTSAQAAIGMPGGRPAATTRTTWGFGDFLPRSWFGPGAFLIDPWRYDLPLPPPGYDWVRAGYDALLVDAYSGRVVQVVRNVFW